MIWELLPQKTRTWRIISILIAIFVFIAALFITTYYDNIPMPILVLLLVLIVGEVINIILFNKHVKKVSANVPEFQRAMEELRRKTYVRYLWVFGIFLVAGIIMISVGIVGIQNIFKEQTAQYWTCKEVLKLNQTLPPSNFTEMELRALALDPTTCAWYTEAIEKTGRLLIIGPGILVVIISLVMLFIYFRQKKKYAMQP